jgi:hypothetical protein
MSITTHTRSATHAEIVAEIDRRGAVIEKLEARIEKLECFAHRFLFHYADSTNRPTVEQEAKCIDLARAALSTAAIAKAESRS